MKKMVIGGKAAANKVLVESLFKPVAGGTLMKERYDMGKYAHNLHGRAVEVPDRVFALWTESRHDDKGRYFALYSIVAPRPEVK